LNVRFGSDINASSSNADANKNILPKNVYANIELFDLNATIKITDNQIDLNEKYNITQKLTNVKIGNYIYEEVAEITIDTTNYFSTRKCWKMVLAKNYGIIAFSKRLPNEEWVRQ
jgi:hypothetical protein